MYKELKVILMEVGTKKGLDGYETCVKSLKSVKTEAEAMIKEYGKTRVEAHVVKLEAAQEQAERMAEQQAEEQRKELLSFYTELLDRQSQVKVETEAILPDEGQRLGRRGLVTSRRMAIEQNQKYKTRSLQNLVEILEMQDERHLKLVLRLKKTCETIKRLQQIQA